MVSHNNDEREPEPVIYSLQPDAEWKNIQQNTFTRWANNHLKKIPDHIVNLETDLSDGLKLIKLVEVLSQKYVGRYSEKVKFRHQKLENVSVALRFLQEEEGIKIINIDSSHIVDQNKKLILGLIWTLILHYSISFFMEGDAPADSQPNDTPKQRLLKWIREKLPDDVPVTNFTYDWNDGLALGGLVNSIAPGMISDWRSWEPDNALQNTSKAMELANSELGVAQLITPEELINPNIDEKSVMTYLAQFPQTKTFPKGRLFDVDYNPIVHRATEFKVSIPSEDAKPKVVIQDASGADIHFIMNRGLDSNEYIYKYTPDKLGPVQITLFTTSLSTGESVKANSAEVTVIKGASLADFGHTGKVGETKYFRVENAGNGPVEIIVVDGENNEHNLPILESATPGTFEAEYLLENPGLHSVNVFHQKASIERSPFPLRVSPKNSWEVWGRGIQPDGVRVGDKVPIFVQAIGAENAVDMSTAPIEVEVINVDGSHLPVTSGVSGECLKFEYTPKNVGEIQVVIKCDGQPIAHSPYNVKVASLCDSPVRAFGPGLEGGVAQHANVFYVNTHGESDHLAFTIEGPSKTTINCDDRGHGIALVEYTPKDSGVYKINILSKGEHIQDSPFVVWIDSTDDQLRPSAVSVTGLDDGVAVLGEKSTFSINTKHAGVTNMPQVAVVDTEYNFTTPDIREVTPGVYECSYIPEQVGPHYVNVGIRGVAVPGSPFPVSVIEPTDVSQLHMYGPGVDGPVVSQQPTHFTIDAKQAGPGAVEVALTDRQGRAVDIDVLDNEDGSFTVKYTAPRPGAYQLNVVFAGVDVPPIEINVKPHIDIAGIRVEGLENENVLIGHRFDVNVNTGENLPSSRGLELIAVEPDGKEYSVRMNTDDGNNYNGQYTVTNVGDTALQLLYDDIPIKEINVNAQLGQDASRCRVTGGGLTSALVGQPANFRIHTQGAGNGGLALEIKGPSESETAIKDHSDGSCTVEYTPQAPGVYQIGIMYGDNKDHIPGSPFTSIVDHPVRPSSIRIEAGEKPVARLGRASSFVIDASETAEAPIAARLPAGQQQPFVEPIENRPRAYSITFSPRGQPGDVLPLEVLYDGEPIPGSPIPVTILPESQPENVRVGENPMELEVFACKDALLTIDTRDCGKVETVKAAVAGPDGRSRKCTLAEGARENEYELRWQTDLSGTYNVDVFVNGVKVSSEPIKVKAKHIGNKYDALLKERPATFEWLLGEDQYIAVERLVDDPNAKVAVLKSHEDGCESEIVTDRSGAMITDLVRLRPILPGKQLVNLVYGGEPIPNGDIPFEAVAEIPELIYSPISAQSPTNKSSRKSSRASSIKSPLSPTADIVGEQRLFNSRTSNSEGGESHDGYSQEVTEEKYYTKSASVESGANEIYQTQQSPLCHQTNSQQHAHQGEHDDEYGKNLFERHFNFNFDPTQIQAHKLTAEITMPNYEKDHAEIIDNNDGTVLVKYCPKQAGPHELTIVHDGAILQGTPIKFFVDSFGAGYATVYGPGLQSAVVGEPAAFTVCAKGSHAKELSVSVEGAAQANIKIHDNKDGTCAVTWVPPVPGEYKVHVKLGGKDVKNSPFNVVVAGAGQKRSHLSVGSTSEVALNIAESQLKGISASIKSPSGIEEPCFVRIIEGGRLGVSFTPREAGEHLITVKRDGKMVPRAPFKIKVDKSQVGDASKVEVTGVAKSRAITMHDNEVLVDTSKAGFGGLSVSVQGPSKAELSCKEVRPGLIAVKYKPTEPGVYVLHIKFADNHVKDSPLTVLCTGPSAGTAQTSIEKNTSQQPISLIGQDSTIFLKLPHTTPLEMSARLTDPKGNTEDIEMRDTGDQYYQIKFQPKMEGLHALSVMHKDQHVNGSPFNFTVGSFAEGGPHKVRASGQGVIRGETKYPNCFNVYTREAGPGKLSVAIEGPSKTTMDFKDHKDGNCHVEYQVAEAGEYIVAVKYNDQHIPDSPFKVFIAPSTGEVRKLELAQFHSGVPAGKAFSFTVLTHRAKGSLEAKVHSPRGNVETIDIVPIEEGESYAMRFLPKETGNHYVHVTLDGAPMRDSPFLLRVGGKNESDPTAIHASGDGLKQGITGQKCEFVVNTCNAGSGILNIQMDGPSKVTLDAYELEHGYKARYTPLAPGDYICAIKYNGIHIPGSPYKIKVDGKTLGGNGYNEISFVNVDAVAKTSKGTVATAPIYTGDADKVVVKGAGLNKFFPGRPAMFNIDTGLAGSNLLFVGIVTTKGPCEEVVVKHMGNGHYCVNYKIHDRVKGFIFIKYGDKEVPGSPFAIEP